MRIKFLLAIFFIIPLTSCYVTRSVIWNDNSYVENFTKIYIDQEGRRIIFPSQDGQFQYVISDDDGSIVKLALWDGLKDIVFTTKYGSILQKDQNLEIPFFILTTTKNVDDEDWANFLESLGFNEIDGTKNQRGKFTKNYVAKEARKFHAEKEVNSNYIVKNLDTPYQVRFLITKETSAQKTSKIILLPFAAVADVVLLPITVPIWLVTHDDGHSEN